MLPQALPPDISGSGLPGMVQGPPVAGVIGMQPGMQQVHDPFGAAPPVMPPPPWSQGIVEYPAPQQQLLPGHLVAQVTDVAPQAPGFQPVAVQQASLHAPYHHFTSEEGRDRDRDRDLDHGRHRSHHGSDRDRDRGRDSDRHRRNRSHSRSRSRGRDGHRHRTRSYSRGRRSRSYSRSRSRSRSRGRERNRDHDRDRGRWMDGGGEGERDPDRHGSRGRSRGDGYSDDPYSDDNDEYSQRGGRGRYSKYECDLEAGLDGQLEARGRGGERRGPSRSRRDSKPTASIHIRGIPESKDESDLYRLLEPWPNVKALRLVRDRVTGQSRGFAFVDFESEADAMVLMESPARFTMTLDGVPLRLDYSLNAANPQVAALPSAPQDWVCDRCSAVNFARRMECYQCSTARPKNPSRVAIEPDGPSPILKVSQLEPSASEDMLYHLFAPHVPVRDVRLVRDKYNGAPRGFAFVEFNSVADAGKAMALLQNTIPAGQAGPIRLCYARDRLPAGPGGANGAAGSGAGGIGAEVVEAAQAMQAYSNWEPKAFDEAAALLVEADAAAAAAAAAAATANDGSTATAEEGKGAPGTAGAATEASSSGQEQSTTGYVYDTNSGYWYDPASGYYYDANTGLFYHPSTSQWYSLDHSTGQYSAVGVGSTDAAGTSSAAQSTIAATEAAVAGARAAASANSAAASQRAIGPSDRKRGAVIGAAPQLNPQGLLAAAEQIKEKEKSAAKAAQKAQMRAGPTMSAKPSTPGASQASKLSTGPQHQARPGPGPAVTAAATPGAPASSNAGAAAGSGVQGVIHRGKWAQKAG